MMWHIFSMRALDDVAHFFACVLPSLWREPETVSKLSLAGNDLSSCVLYVIDKHSECVSLGVHFINVYLCCQIK